MRLRVAFVLYEASGDIMPNAVAVTDEYMEDEHNGIPTYYSEQIKDDRAMGAGCELRECFIEIPDGAVLALFEPMTIKGTVVDS